MSYEKISLSIEINKPPSKVFTYLKSIEKRIRLNPSYEMVKFEYLTEGDLREGTQYKITAKTDKGLISYQSVVKELIENEKMVTETINGKMRISISLKPSPKGTVLYYTEEFELPPEVLLKEEEANQGLFQALLSFFFRTGGFCQDTLLKRKNTLLENLKEKAQIYLQRIKEDLENSI
ncbi:MAG: hypothetical protein N2Z40_05125 [Caldimicrobium sp.]|nr:hypothetical protein [Caldimicrobium sp.]MCX7613583.1 hypothetical protein [Caldimicrobium sp.]MDW8182343.1 hypothetical protein [Caldimicrobium sp.]